MKRKYISEFYDYKEYEKEYLNIINSNELINIKVSKLAYYMVTKFPKLPYFWGGGHNLTKDELKGLDKDWGKLEVIKDYGNDKYVVGSYYPKSFDCSGFVTWCLVNCGYDLDKYVEKPNIDYSLNSKDFVNIGQVYKMNDERIIKIIKLGDLVYQIGHIGIVCEIDYEKEIIKVAHISDSGGGSNLTTISLITSRVIDDSDCLQRVGNIYFTDIISINY